MFTDGRNVVLRNTIEGALALAEFAAVRMSLDALQQEYPNDARLGDLQLLHSAFSHSAIENWSGREQLRQARETMLCGVFPAAARVYSASADVRARPLWRDLAESAQTQIERIPSWRRIPAPLSWMIEARYRQQGLDPLWPMLAELGWLSPTRLGRLIDALGDALLLREAGSFR